jgi:hypothetical protein
MASIEKLKKHRLLFLTVFCFGSLSCFSQGNGNGDAFWNRVRYGGAFGLGFGNNTVNLVAAPSAVYSINEQFALGTGLSLNYAKFGDTKFTAYGAGLMTYYNPIPSLQLSAEYEQLRVHRSFGIRSAEPSQDYWLPVLYFGLGYSTGPVTFGVRYDILYDTEKSLYADPWMPFVRIFF